MIYHRRLISRRMAFLEFYAMRISLQIQFAQIRAHCVAFMHYFMYIRVFALHTRSQVYFVRVTCTFDHTPSINLHIILPCILHKCMNVWLLLIFCTRKVNDVVYYCYSMLINVCIFYMCDCNASILLFQFS